MNRQINLFDNENEVKYGNENVILEWLKSNYPKLNFRKVTRDGITYFYAKWEKERADDILQFRLGATSYKYDSHYLSPFIKIDDEFMKGVFSSVHSYEYLGKLIDEYIRKIIERK